MKQTNHTIFSLRILISVLLQEGVADSHFFFIFLFKIYFLGDNENIHGRGYGAANPSKYGQERSWVLLHYLGAALISSTLRELPLILGFIARYIFLFLVTFIHLKLLILIYPLFYNNLQII